VKKMDAAGRTRSSSALPSSAGDGAPTVRGTIASASLRPALHLLLSKTIEFLLSTGESPEHIALELEGQAERINGRLSLWSAKDAKQIQDGRERYVEVAGVIHDWHREPAYTNQDGDPLQLTERSLRTLVSKRFSKQKIAVAVRWMYEDGLIRKTTRGKIALIGGRQVVYIMKRRRRAVVLERAAALIPQYLRTALRNADTQDLQSRDIDRDARVFFLPQKYVPLWRAVARERTQVFLEGIDNWLEDHARRDDPGPVREVAVHCYAYTGESRSHKGARTNRRRLKALA
jgi:hypothetical protein